MNALETKFKNSSRKQKTNWLLSMDAPTKSEDLKIDEIISYNEKGEGFAPYHTEKKMIVKMVRKGLVVDTISGVYAIAYLCNL